MVGEWIGDGDRAPRGTTGLGGAAGGEAPLATPCAAGWGPTHAGRGAKLGKCAGKASRLILWYKWCNSNHNTFMPTNESLS